MLTSKSSVAIHGPVGEARALHRARIHSEAGVHLVNLKSKACQPVYHMLDFKRRRRSHAVGVCGDRGFIFAKEKLLERGLQIVFCE